MIRRNTRRSYITGEQPENKSPEVSALDSSTDNSLNSIAIERLKVFSRNLDEMKQSLRVLEETLEYIDLRIRKVEDGMDRIISKSREADLDFISMKKDLDTYRKKNTYHSYEAQANMNSPIMPGTGFASITPDYLKGLHQK